MSGRITTNQARNLISKIALEFDKKRSQDTDFLFLLSLVRELYNNSERTLFELAQNADDSGASSLFIHLEDGCLSVWHDGRPFDKNDVAAICGVGKSNKTLGSHIGFMGLGFKSAFFISPNPEVHSTPFHFAFDDSVIRPNWINFISEDIISKVESDLTVFRLPFDKENSALYSEIRTVAGRFSESFFALLRNVKRIEFSDANAVLFKSELVANEKYEGGMRKLAFKTKREGEKEDTKYYIIYQRNISIPDEINESRRQALKIPSVAKLNSSTTINLLAQLNSKGELFPQQSPLYLYFPLEMDLDFGMIISAEFIPNKLRTEIERNCDWNTWLINQIGDAVRDYVIELMNTTAHRVQTFKILPQNKKYYYDINRMLQSQLISSTVKYLNSTKSIPTMQRSLAKPDKVLMLPPRTAMVFSTSDFAKAINSNEYIMASNVSGRGFLQEFLDIAYIDELTAIKKILDDKLLLRNKTPNWFNKFYHLLSQKKDQLGASLKDYEFVLTTRGELASPTSVHLPSTRRKKIPNGLPGVSIAETEEMDKKSFDFLQEIGVSKIAPKSLVLKLLGLCRNGSWHDWKDADLIALCAFTSDFLEKNELLETSTIDTDIQELIHFLPIPVKIGKKRDWALACQSYLPKSEYAQLLTISRIIDKRRMPDYLYNHRIQIGVNSGPAIIEFGKIRSIDSIISEFGVTPNLWWNYLSSCRSFQYHPTWEEVEFTIIDGFEEILQSGNPEKIRLLFKSLIQSWQKYKPHLRAKWNGFYQIQRGPSYIDSYLAYRLKNAKWIPVKRKLLQPWGLYLPLKKLRGLGTSVTFIPQSFLPREQHLDDASYDFLKFLGIIIDPSVDDLMNILSTHKKISLEIGETIYRLLSDKSLNELKGVDESPRYLLSQYHEAVANQFAVKKAQHLYYFYDRIFISELHDIDLLAWTTENVALPEVLRIFEAFNVKRGPSYLSRRLVAKGRKLDGYATIKIREKSSYLHSTLIHQNSKRTAKNYLEKVNVVFVEFLDIEAKLGNTRRRLSPKSYCDTKHNVLYLTPESTKADVARELLLTFDVQDSPGNILHILNSEIETLPQLMASLGINVIQEFDDNSHHESGEIQEHAEYEAPVFEQKESIETMSSEKIALGGDSFFPLIQDTTTTPSQPIPLFEQSSRNGHLRVTDFRSGFRTGGGGGFPLDAMKRGRFGELYVMMWEEKQERGPVVDRANDPTYPGYDIESQEKDGSKRFIEVKTWSGSDPEITPNEFRAAMKYKSQYYLYVLSRRTLYIIKDPLNSIDVLAKPSYEMTTTTYTNDEDLIKSAYEKLMREKKSR